MPGSTLRLIIGNWKMHGSLARNAALLNALTQGAEQLSETLEHFSVRLPKERARRQYGDRCGRSRSPSRSDGGDPAASSYGEREATPGKPLKRRYRLQYACPFPISPKLKRC